MQEKYDGKAAFYIVYIREAHPTDGWQTRANRRDGILFEQPKSILEREEVAQSMCEKLEINLPCLIDGIDNRVGDAYAGLPDRLYVVGIDGKIAYKGDRGPRGFKPAEVAEFLKGYLPKTASAAGAVNLSGECSGGQGG